MDDNSAVFICMEKRPDDSVTVEFVSAYTSETTGYSDGRKVHVATTADDVESITGYFIDGHEIPTDTNSRLDAWFEQLSETESAKDAT